MPGNNELADMLRSVIQEELKPVRRELQELRHGQEMLGSKADKLELRMEEELKPVKQELHELRHGQEMLGSKADKLELRMENDVVEKVRALFDGFILRGEQVENLQKHLDRRLDSIEIDTGYLVSKVVNLEKMAK